MLSRTSLIWLNRLLWTVLVGAVLLFGIVVSLGRHYLPYIGSHQREVIDALNQRTGLHFSAARISGRWQHLSPHFVVDDLRLYNPQNPAEVVLQIDHAELQLGIFRSINARTLAISRLQGSGVHLQLVEAPLGRWHLPGFEQRTEVNVDAVLDFLLAIYRAGLSDTRIDLQFVGGGRAQVGGALQLQRAGDFRRLNLALTTAKKAAPFTLLLETHGDPRADSFAARAHVAFNGIDLAPLLPIAKALGGDLRHGFIDGELWLDWRARDVIEVRGRAALPQLDVAGLSGQALAPITDLKTEFLLRSEAGRRQLWLPRLSGNWGGARIDLRQLQFSADDARPDFCALAIPELQLAALRDIVAANTGLPPRLRDIVAALEPSGALRNVRLELPLKSALRDQLRLRAQLERIVLRPWEGAPGVEGGGGYVDARLRGGTLDLASDAFALEFPHVYREPLHFDRVRGRIGWNVEDERVLVASGPIPVHAEAGRATARFSLDLPTGRGGRPLMTLMVGLRDSAAQYHRQFVPYTVPANLLDWLQKAVRGGELPRGGFIYRGSLRSGDYAERSVQLFLDVNNGELAYQPDWPPLHHVRADVWLDDDDLLVRAPTASMFKAIAARDVVVELQHPPGGSWLSVRANASGEDDDVLRLLRESPLHKNIGPALDAWNWRGKVQSQLDLGFALGGERAPELRVDSELGPGTLTFNYRRIVLTDVRGNLNYRSGSGLQSNVINARWYGRPQEAKVVTNAGGDINVEVAGRIGMVDLKDCLQQPLFAYADGDVPYKATLHIAGEDSAVTVHSDLQGASLQLPAPYRKAAADSLPLDVRMTVGSQRELLAELGDWADLRLRWGPDTQVDAAVLRLGKTGRTQFATGQMIVTGRVPDFDLDAWRDALSGQRSSSAAEPADALALVLREVKFGTVTAAGQTLTALQLSGHREADGWQLGVSGAQMNGTLRLADSAQQPWVVKMNYLRLPEPQAAAADRVGSAFAQMDPAKIIPLDLSITHLWRGNEELGSLALQLRPIADGVRMDNLSGQLRGVTIGARAGQPASISWTRRDGADQTEFDARLQVDDIGAALQRWHYEPVLTSKSGAGNIALRWPGAPDQFQFTRAEGEAQLQFEDGRFLKASSSASGALKVVGIFNFANFLKRLQLDFSDVFKDGVSFDSMKGGVAIQQGVLRTGEPVEIKSPSSRFRIAGQIDFNTDQTDMELVATLPVASNLPWVAALAAGLPAAAGVYVASKLFENQVDKFSSAAYDVSGPWTDPSVKLKRVFDDTLHRRPAQQDADKESTKP